MIRINLLEPKAEPTAIPGRFILPLWRISRKQVFMAVELKRTHFDARYSLKKILVFCQEN